jgi:SHAQKYF class myb-like DNA-binding protein
MEPRIRINPQINTVQDCFIVFNKKSIKTVRNQGSDFDSLNTSCSRDKPHFYHPYHSAKQSNPSRNNQRDKLLYFNREELAYYDQYYQQQQQQQPQQLPSPMLSHSEEKLFQKSKPQQLQQHNYYPRFEHGNTPKAQVRKHELSKLTNDSTQNKHSPLPTNSTSVLSLSATELSTSSLQSMASPLNEATMDSQSPSTDSESSKMYNKGDWTEEEHTRFLKGYEECGCQWKLIAENYVKTRDRRQTSSHAQNFLKKIRQQQQHPIQDGKH